MATIGRMIVEVQSRLVAELVGGVEDFWATEGCTEGLAGADVGASACALTPLMNPPRAIWLPGAKTESESAAFCRKSERSCWPGLITPTIPPGQWRDTAQ